jgi:hypothetical protein
LFLSKAKWSTPSNSIIQIFLTTTTSSVSNSNNGKERKKKKWMRSARFDWSLQPTTTECNEWRKRLASILFSLYWWWWWFCLFLLRKKYIKMIQMLIK